MSDASQGTSVPRELSKDDLLKYVELDLWTKFQDRLWKVVGFVLTGITVIGLLGVPYYIKSEVNSALQKQALDFKNRTDEIIAYSKLIAIQTTSYTTLRHRFDSDVYRLVEAIENSRTGATEEERKAWRFQDPVETLPRLVSRQDFSQVVAGSITNNELLSVPPDLKDKSLLPRTSYLVENKGLQGSGAYVEPHPVRDGKYSGSIRDIRFQIVVLEGLGRTISSMQEKLLALGGTSDLEGRIEAVRAKTIEADIFEKNLAKEVAGQANAFLSESDQTEFARVQQFYLAPSIPKYVAPPPSQVSSSASAASPPSKASKSTSPPSK